MSRRTDALGLTADVIQTTNGVTFTLLLHWKYIMPFGIYRLLATNENTLMDTQAAACVRSSLLLSVSLFVSTVRDYVTSVRIANLTDDFATCTECRRPLDSYSVWSLDRRSHIKPAELQRLHWLPVRFRIICKIATFVYCILRSAVRRCPQYFMELVTFNDGESGRPSTLPALENLPSCHHSAYTDIGPPQRIFSL